MAKQARILAGADRRVTGAARGIGRATARRAAQRHARGDRRRRSGTAQATASELGPTTIALSWT